MKQSLSVLDKQLMESSDLIRRAREIRARIKAQASKLGELKSGKYLYFTRKVDVRDYHVAAHQRTILSKKLGPQPVGKVVPQP